VGFVDIHSHILHGLDDGARTAAESVAMLELAAASGTSDIVATPHANARYAFRPELVEQRIDELRRAVTRIQVHYGCDFHLKNDNIEDAIVHPQRYAINHDRYLLVEFPEAAIVAKTSEILSSLIGAGLVPILTHPERTLSLYGRVIDIERWVEMGCYVQVTAGSCVGQFGPRARNFVATLMTRRLVHFVASDAHDCELRPPGLSAAYSTLAQQWGEASARPLFEDNPRAVITGAPIVPMAAARPRRKWYQFWS